MGLKIKIFCETKHPKWAGPTLKSYQIVISSMNIRSIRYILVHDLKLIYDTYTKKYMIYDIQE